MMNLLDGAAQRFFTRALLISFWSVSILRLSVTAADRCPAGLRYYYWPCNKCLKDYAAPQRLPTASFVEPDGSRAAWMNQLNRTRLLRSLVLPGAHHAAVNGTRHYYYVTPLANWDYGQLLSVAEQLQMGVRFLDLRVSTGTSSSVTLLPVIAQPTITHNYMYVFLDDVLQVVSDFLRAQPTEMVVVKISPGATKVRHWLKTFNYTTDWKKVDAVLERYKSIIWNNSVGSPLEQSVRSLGAKMVLCIDDRGRNESRYSGFWQCKGSYNETATSRPDQLRERASAWLSGRANKTSASGYSGLSEAGMSVWSAICTTDASLISPFQCYNDAASNTKLYRAASMRDLAELCNAQVLQFIEQHKESLRRKLHAIYTDYVHPRIINEIIALNN